MQGTERGAGESGSGPISPIMRFLFVDSTLGWLLALLSLLGGLMAYMTMVKEADPDLGIPAAMVQTAWPGAGPTLVEREVTDVLERAIQSLDHLKRYDSGSRSGLSVIFVEFAADAPTNEVIQSLRARVADAAADLPAAAGRPRVEQMSTTDIPALTVTLRGDVSPAVLSDTARDLKRRLERLSPVRKVDLEGAREDVARIVVDPHRLAGHGLSLNELRQSIEQAAVDVPLGRLENDVLSATVTLRGRFTDLSQLARLPVREGRGGDTVRLGDVASLRHDLSVATDEIWSSLDGGSPAPTVLLTLYKMPGADTVRLVDLARDTLATHTLPPGVETRITSDQSIIVKEKLHEVFVNAVQAIIAVIVVLVLLLSWRAALIAGLAVPITFLGALLLLQAMGMTLNTLVVVGMVLALGLMVDVFILVVEGMVQATRERGLRFAEAARWTVRTYALPAFAGQMTTILALMPLLFLSGVSGKFIRLVPLTAIVCLVVSYIIAFLWAIPASRRILGQGGGSAGPLDRPLNWVASALHGFLARRVVARRRQAVAWSGGALALVVAGLLLAGTLSMEMYPKEDNRHMAATVELAPGTPLDQSRAVGVALADALRAEPWLESLVLHLGQRSPYAQTSSTDRLAWTPGTEVIGLSLNLTDLDQRKGRLSHTYLTDIRDLLQPIVLAQPGASLQVVAGSGGPGGGDAATVVLQGEDLESLRAAADRIKSLLAGRPGVLAVSDDTGNLRQDMMAIPRREALAAHGIALQQVADELTLAMNRTRIADFPAPPGRDDPVPVELSVDWGEAGPAGGSPRWVDGLGALRVPTAQGSRISVSALLAAGPEPVPPVILRRDGTRSITVAAELEPGLSSLAFMAGVQSAVAAELAAFPSVQLAVADAAAEQAQTASDMGRLFLLALVLILSTLILLFRSTPLALIILCTVPLAMVGVFAGFAAISMPLSFPAMVGLVSLIGIVVNTAIVMIETMTTHRREGRDIAAAAALGASDRLRPILSTSLTTIAGLILLSTASPMWQPLCYAIIFGLIASTLLSLIIVPALYRLAAPANPAS